MPQLFRARSLFVIACFSLLSGCAVGPDYVRPEQPTLSSYVRARGLMAPAKDPALGTELRWGQSPPRDWWRWFESETLNRLVDQSFEGSVTIEAARARMQRAALLLAAERGLAWPAIDSTAGAGRQNATAGAAAGGTPAVGSGQGGQGSVSGGASPGPFTVYTAAASVSYDLDLFGRIDRSIEAAQAQLINQQAQFQAAYLSLVGNVVSTTLAIAGVREQIKVRNELIAGQRKRLGVVQARFEEGYAARADVLATRAEVSALQATLPPLRQQLGTLHNRLAELLGQAPSQLEPIEVDLENFKLPATIPVVLPSTLVGERPDILAAEALLAAASANIGVATANLYPNISLSANLGGQRFDASGFSSGWDKTWSIGANLIAPLFEGGRRRALRDAAIADWEAALAQYRGTVLGAFREVADGLLALENNAAALQAQQAALADARKSLELVNFMLDEGAISVIDVLTVERRYRETYLAYIDVRAQRLQDAAALFAALGRSPVEHAAAGIDAGRTTIRKTSAALEQGIAPAAIKSR